jgi:hypothetical protein
MKRHECPTCGQHYECTRAEDECGSPLVYDCFFCYVSRYAKQLESAAGDVSERFGIRPFTSGSPDVCYAN